MLLVRRLRLLLARIAEHLTKNKEVKKNETDVSPFTQLNERIV